jgi:hypothetical protein
VWQTHVQNALGRELERSVRAQIDFEDSGLTVSAMWYSTLGCVAVAHILPFWVHKKAGGLVVRGKVAAHKAETTVVLCSVCLFV